MTETRQSTETPPESVPLLDSIQGPEDLKRLAEDQLPRLCEEVREFILESVQRTGGHLGSNTGVVELAVALHYVFDFKHDRLVWDVSHQCYPHKILTGRRGGFNLLRKTGGMCGFTNPHESEFDLFHTGHAGTSISLGLGLATGAEVEQDSQGRQIVSVIGDASLGAGVAFEALNNAGATGRKMLVILNDNEWSISKSVGSLARYLSRIRANRLMQRAGQETKNLIHAIPVIGPKVDKALDDLGEVMRHAVVPGHVFEELGVRYVGPIDGHDVHLLIRQLRSIAQLEGPVVLHILTEKGKGHPDGPEHPERVHAVKGAPAKAEPAKAAKATGKNEAEAYKTEPAPNGGPVASDRCVSSVAPSVSFTTAFAHALSGLAEKDVRVHALTAAMPSGTGLDAFAERFPARFHDTGITEQHAVAMAAGMAKAGLRPVAAIYSTFLQRGYDQVFQEVALQNLPVLFALDRAGPVGQDGPTHNGVFDIAYMRTLPGFTLCSPRDATDLRRMLAAGLTLDGPCAVRYPRGNCSVDEIMHESERREMQPGKAEVLRIGDERLVIWAYGSMVTTAIDVADRLRARGVEIGVVDARYAKPLDENLLAEHAAAYRNIVTLEDHQRAGGFGSAVLEAFSRLPLTGDRRQARVRVLGVPDRFLDHKSSREEQLAEVGLDPDGVERTLNLLLKPSLKH